MVMIFIHVTLLSLLIPMVMGLVMGMISMMTMMGFWTFMKIQPRETMILMETEL